MWGEMRIWRRIWRIELREKEGKGWKKKEFEWECVGVWEYEWLLDERKATHKVK